MKFHSLRTSLVGSAFALVGALLLGSCGGGGAGTNNEGGAITLLPADATFFAGMPGTLIVQGGRRPYRIVSSQPGLLPVPETVNASSFTVVPNNPGVIDTGTAVDELPVRTVVVTASDASNTIASMNVRVAQNFLTSYGVSFISNCPPTTGGTTSPQACGGGETAVRIEAIFDGTLRSNRTFRLDILRGPFSWVFSPGGPIVGQSVTVVTDHEGKTNAIFRVNSNVATQIGVFRITDVATGASTEQLFIIDGTVIGAALTIIPDEFTFTGANTASCGTGSGDFLVFDGTPPYSAVSSSGAVSVTATSNTQPGRFTLNAGDPSTCVTDAAIIVTDANNARGTVTVTTETGSADPPPAALRVIPNVVTLAICGQSGMAVITGGAGTGYSAASSTPNILANVVGNSITVTDTRGTTPGAPAPPISATVTITDGASTVPLRVNYQANCT